MAESRPVALITGASGGVGRAVAKELAQHGHDAALLYRSNADAVTEAVQAVEEAGGQAIAIQADLADPDAAEQAVDAAIQHFGMIDVLAHCAGAYTAWKTIRGLSAQEWQEFLNADLSSFFYVLSACMRHMHERTSGVVVAVSSIAAQACPPRG